MVSDKVVIKNPTGLHLRPAGLFCKTAMQYKSKITVYKKMKNEEVNANAKSVLSVLGACIKSGDEITIICEGEGRRNSTFRHGSTCERWIGRISSVYKPVYCNSEETLGGKRNEQSNISNHGGRHWKSFWRRNQAAGSDWTKWRDYHGLLHL